MAWVHETMPCKIVANFNMQFKQLHDCCIKGLTVQLEYFNRLVVSTNWVASGSHPGLTLINIRVSDGDPVATLLYSTVTVSLNDVISIT